jgi:hypothetical protein
MTVNRDEGTPLRAENEEFAERLAASFSPAPLSPAQRAAFNEALAARLERRRRSRLLVPALAAAAGAAAAALVWLAAPGAFDPTATGGRAADDVVAEASAAARWELGLLDLDSLIDADDVDDFERLPDDYAAIAGTFL